MSIIKPTKTFTCMKRKLKIPMLFMKNGLPDLQVEFIYQMHYATAKCRLTDKTYYRTTYSYFYNTER